MQEKGRQRGRKGKSQGRVLFLSKHSVAVNLDGINELEQTTKMRKNYLAKAFCTSDCHEVTDKGGGIACLRYLYLRVQLYPKLWP